MHDLVSARRDAIAELCRRFHVQRLEVFGSAARGTDFDTQRSDADFLIEFQPGTQPTIGLLLDLEGALANTLGRSVDLVERKAIEESRNYLRRRRNRGEGGALPETAASPSPRRDATGSGPNPERSPPGYSPV